MRDLAGRVAVITGAAEGIGRAFAERAAALGMKLVLADINPALLEATAEALRQSSGVEVVTQVTDVANEQAVHQLADLAFSRFSAVHLLINNAGIASGGNAWETSTQDWQRVLGINLFGVIHGLQAFIPRMIAGGDEGHIVNIASAAGLLSQPGMASYNVTKHGVVTLTEGLYHDLKLRKTRLSASVVCPAWVKTRIADEDKNAMLQIGDADPLVQKMAQAVKNAVAHGIPPARVAEMTFDAVQADQFYVLTHDPVKLAVALRLRDIEEGRQPRLVPNF